MDFVIDSMSDALERSLPKFWRVESGDDFVQAHGRGVTLHIDRTGQITMSRKLKITGGGPSHTVREALSLLLAGDLIP